VTITNKGRELSSLIAIKTEKTATEIAVPGGLGFDTALRAFLGSRAYRNLLNPETLTWGENAAYIADEYQRESSAPTR
jgi:hypothetical protein